MAFCAKHRKLLGECPQVACFLGVPPKVWATEVQGSKQTANTERTPTAKQPFTHLTAPPLTVSARETPPGAPARAAGRTPPRALRWRRFGEPRLPRPKPSPNLRRGRLRCAGGPNGWLPGCLAMWFCSNARQARPLEEKKNTREAKFFRIFCL